MADERVQQIGSTPQATQLVPEPEPQLMCRVGGVVRQPLILGPAPHPLVGIGLGRIAGEVLREDLRVLRQVLLHHRRSAVNLAAVPDDRHRATQRPLRPARKATVSSAWALVLSGSSRKYRPRRRRSGLDGHGADGRDAALAMPGPLDGGLAPRGVGAAHQGLELEARLVQEDQVGMSLVGLADDPRQFLVPSVGDGRLVALLGLSLRLLAAPAQPLADQFADVLDVVSDAEVFGDHLGDPAGAPEVVVVAMGPRALQKQGLQLSDLRVGEQRGGARMGLGVQLVGGLAGELQPGVDGGAAAAEDAGHVVDVLAVLDQFNGPASSSFELFGGSDGSHTLYYDPPVRVFGLPGWTQ